MEEFHEEDMEGEGERALQESRGQGTVGRQRRERKVNDEKGKGNTAMKRRLEGGGGELKEQEKGE